MSPVATFRAGDSVTITYEGVVRGAAEFDGYVTLDNANGSVHLSLTAASDISVTSRPLKADDTLLGAEIRNSDFPVGSVVRYVGGDHTWLRTAGGWYSCLDLDATSNTPLVPDAAYTILYLAA